MPFLAPAKAASHHHTLGEDLAFADSKDEGWQKDLDAGSGCEGGAGKPGRMNGGMVETVVQYNTFCTALSTPPMEEILHYDTEPSSAELLRCLGNLMHRLQYPHLALEYIHRGGVTQKTEDDLSSSSISGARQENEDD